MTLSSQPVTNVEPQDFGEPTMTTSRGVVLPLGVLQAVVLVVAIVVACVVLLRRQAPVDR